MGEYSDRIRLPEHHQAGYLARYEPESYDPNAPLATAGFWPRSYSRTLHQVHPGDHPFVAA
jgi:hypothetical protein